MRVKEIMSEPVDTVPPVMRLDEASDLMRRFGLHHLIVKDVGKVVGVLSTSDLMEARARGSTDGLRVEDVMSLNVASIDQNETVRRAANLMRGRSIGCLAVTEKSKLVGIVTVSDLLNLLGRGGERRATAERASLHYRVPHRRQHSSSRW